MMMGVMLARALILVVFHWAVAMHSPAGVLIAGLAAVAVVFSLASVVVRGEYRAGLYLLSDAAVALWLGMIFALMTLGDGPIWPVAIGLGLCWMAYVDGRKALAEMRRWRTASQ